MSSPDSHPFDPLTAGEIASVRRHPSIFVLAVPSVNEHQVASLVRSQFTHSVLFRVITLVEPRKHEMLRFLEAEYSGMPPTPPKRIARVHAYIERAFHELLVDVGARNTISHEVLEGKHSHVDAAYMQSVEEACLRDVRVQKAIEALKLPEEASVVVEPWTYATDGVSNMSTRITMVRSHMDLYRRSLG